MARDAAFERLVQAAKEGRLSEAVMAGDSSIERDIRAHLERKRIREAASIPTSEFEYDLHILTTITKGGLQASSAFNNGVQARCQGQAKEHMPIPADSERLKITEQGWDWADRMIEGRKLLAYIEEGNP